MGNLGCCPSNIQQKSFKEYCINHASPDYKDFFSEINDVPHQVIIHQTRRNILLDLGMIVMQRQAKELYFSEKLYYEGDIVDSKANGKGKIIWPNRITYEGEIKENRANGVGELVFLDQSMSLKGIWEQGEPRINSKFCYNNHQQESYITIIEITNPSDSIYKTQSKIIKVRIEFEDGSIYEGEVKHKKNNSFIIQGQGKLIFKDGSQYIGSFYDGNMHEPGLYRWPNGHQFQGQYKKNHRDGFGTYFIDSKIFKKGIWRGGQLQTEFTAG